MINEIRPMNHLTSLQNFICTIGNLPTSYALSLSYEEQIWWLCDFLEKKVFPAIEENTNITEETQQAFIELQNYVRDYFNNLDVQEEINNKLDEMVENGQLNELLRPYMQTIEENVNIKLNIQDDKINALQMGTPLVANSILEMTDTTKPYVLTTDGKWYYYNGTSWVIGGDYQTSTDHLNLTRLGLIIYEDYESEIDRDNYFITTTGVLSYSNTYAISKKISLKKGDIITSIQRSTTTVAAIAKYKQDLSSTNPTVVLVNGTINPSNPQQTTDSYTYIATEDIDVVLSYAKEYQPEITITTSNKINKEDVYNKQESDNRYILKNTLNINKIFVEKNNNIFNIFILSPYTNKYTKYTFLRETIASRNYDCWRIKDISICNENFEEIYNISPTPNSGTECEGALLETNASDFIGGYHGDENLESISILIDDKEIDLNNNFEMIVCDKVEARVVSILNRCNTPEVNVFRRQRTDTWNASGLTIKNYLVALNTITIHQPALSLLAIRNKFNNLNVVDKYSFNKHIIPTDIPSFEDNQDHSFENTTDFLKAELYGDLAVSVEMKDFYSSHSTHNNRGQFTQFANGRTKIYEYPFISETFNTNDIIKCTSVQKIFALQ